MPPWLVVLTLKCSKMNSSSKHGRFGFCFIKIRVNLPPKTLLEELGGKIGEKSEVGLGDHPAPGS